MPPNNTLTSSDNAAPTAAAPESPAVVTIKRSKVHGTVTAAADDDNKNMSSSSKHDSSAADDWNYWDHLYPVNILWFILLHLGAAYGLTLVFTEAKIATTIFAVFTYGLSLFGITAGVHRLWSHRSYKAILPLRIFLAFCNSVSYQNSIYVWARDHRVHHKYTETNADPVNSSRGFFFSHVGWLLCKKHPDVNRIGGKVDMSDILADPVVHYQRKYYALSVLGCCFIVPTLVPWYFWGESLWASYFVAVVLRYCLALNATWLVNSAAHMFGNRPYDETIAPVENLTVSALTLGEGYHNFHHTFPWHYSTSEWGWSINLTTVFLDLFEQLGWIYDVKRVTPEMVKARVKRTGPGGTHKTPKTEHEYMWTGDQE